jgi:L-arabinokinase
VINDSQWHGYLANLAPAEFEERFAAKLPESLTGDEFIARYRGTTDTVTKIEPGRTYAIRAPTAHAVYENSRVQRFAELLRGNLSEKEKVALGELMYESHASYSACGLGSKRTDLIVELVKAAGVERGLFGAKITGGGSGGTVAILGSRNAAGSVAEVADSFAELTGERPYIFSGSSPGSAAFGIHRLHK